jgi:hypothetical protein
VAALALPSPTTSSSPPPAAPTSTETVHRPDPGIARGKWEAPWWSFWVMLGAVVLFAAIYVLVRSGVLRRPRRATPDVPPPSKRP